MNGSWWIALTVVVALALLVTLVDGLARGGRRRRGAARGVPLPGEVWWAEVPFEDRPGGKDRPCLVLAVRGAGARVVKITSRDRGEGAGVIALPPGTVERERPSFLETREVRTVPLTAFRRRVGSVDRALWKRVRHLA